MNTMLVSYDLVSPGRDYDSLLEHLRSYYDYCRPLESFWLLKTSDSHVDVRDAVSKYLDSNDKLVVIDITGDAAAWRGLSDEASAWLKNKL